MLVATPVVHSSVSAKAEGEAFESLHRDVEASVH